MRGTSPMTSKPWYEKPRGFENTCGRMDAAPPSPRKQGGRAEEDLAEAEEIDAEDVYEEDFEDDEAEDTQRLAFTPRQIDTDQSEAENGVAYDSDFEDQDDEGSLLERTALDISCDSVLNVSHDEPLTARDEGEETLLVLNESQDDTARVESKDSESKDSEPKSPESKEEDFEKCVSEGWQEIPFEEIELGDQIGGGGVGIVYNGWYQDQRVALKTLFDPRVNAELKQEYMDELLVLSKLSHPNIVEFYGASMKAPNLCFVMELCEMSLYALLHQTSEELCVKQLTQMLVGVSEAMWYLHTRKPMIIHRDIKSLNLLVADNDSLKLCDFGLVSTKITVAGTPSYMAPELLEKKPFSRRVDMYSFGVLMWEIFLRSIPYAGMAPFEIKQSVCAGERLILPEGEDGETRMPTELKELCQRAWAHEPYERPEFDVMTFELKRALENMPDTPLLSNVEQLEYDMGGDCLGDALGSLMSKK